MAGLICGHWRRGSQGETLRAVRQHPEERGTTVETLSLRRVVADEAILVFASKRLAPFASRL